MYSGLHPSSQYAEQAMTLNQRRVGWLWLQCHRDTSFRREHLPNTLALTPFLSGQVQSVVSAYFWSKESKHCPTTHRSILCSGRRCGGPYIGRTFQARNGVQLCQQSEPASHIRSLMQKMGKGGGDSEMIAKRPSALTGSHCLLLQVHCATCRGGSLLH